MSLVPERLRPYLAGLLGTLATGFGHLYLRRWLRGFGWIALAFAATIAFVPDGTLQAISAGEAVANRAELYPAMAIQLIGAVDAFVLAYRENSGVASTPKSTCRSSPRGNRTPSPAPTAGRRSTPRSGSVTGVPPSSRRPTPTRRESAASRLRLEVIRRRTEFASTRVVAVPTVIRRQWFANRHPYLGN
ncbi:hypothetical protein SY89_02759 [Halolamina pelagica]|uniref:TM2 domain-containing protein n=1 Tax=Halolamina pelagica TaxID=699431 RepID=A0A0P7GSU4_9EURY|nr:hypothetical protein [Halolamina pelagica]KPN32002.1 hypothetical protein SY89_02759 [Halolamina pelagica]